MELFKRRRTEDLTEPLRRLHDEVIAAVDAGDDGRVRQLVAATAAVELLDRDNDLYPADHHVAEFTAEATREGRARIAVVYAPDAAPSDEAAAAAARRPRAWRCALTDGAWHVTDIARPAATGDTGDRGVSHELALGAMGGIGGLNSDPEAVMARERRGKL